MVSGSFQTDSLSKLGPRDIRFTRNKTNTVIYAIVLGWPTDVFVVQSLGTQLKATLAQNPVSTGKAALKDIIMTLSGKTAPTWEAPSQLGAAPALIDKAWLDAHPDYKAEWQG